MEKAVLRSSFALAHDLRTVSFGAPEPGIAKLSVLPQSLGESHESIAGRLQHPFPVGLLRLVLVF